MVNRITESYFEHQFTQTEASEVFRKLSEQLQFQSHKLIFMGKVYQDDKIGTLTHSGIWQNQPAVLKIQFLRPQVHEAEINQAFTAQNQSKSIRAPKIFHHQDWNQNDGYGFILMEHVDGKPIYQNPLATQQQSGKFCRFYQDYRQNTINTEFLQSATTESPSSFVTKRINHWTQVAEHQGHLTAETKAYAQDYLELIQQQSLPLEFQHGHLDAKSIVDIGDNQYVLFSLMFFGPRPLFYDATFHLWAGIKSIRDLSVDSTTIIDYLENWLQLYLQLPAIANQHSQDFPQIFALNLMERLVGSLLVDLENENYPEHRSIHLAHLRDLHKLIYRHFKSKIYA